MKTILKKIKAIPNSVANKIKWKLNAMDKEFKSIKAKQDYLVTQIKIEVSDAMGDIDSVITRGFKKMDNKVNDIQNFITFL